jgi:aldehyde dehydrogenase (NAD+)
MFCTAFSLRPLRGIYKAPILALYSIPRRPFHTSPFVMSDISVQLTAPNGRSYTQPIGLFINNEFVAAKSGEKFATVNPAYVLQKCIARV